MLDAIWKGGRLHVAGRELAADLKLSEGSSLTLGIRPDDLIVTEAEGLFQGKVNVLEPLGTETLAYVDIGGREVIAKADGRTPPKLGAQVHLTADLANMHLFDQSGKAIR
jgi:multiple sugar transport system ATP-binding protein